MSNTCSMVLAAVCVIMPIVRQVMSKHMAVSPKAEQAYDKLYSFVQWLQQLATLLKLLG